MTPSRTGADAWHGPFDAVVFAGGGCRCVWQAGFWSVAAPALDLRPRLVGAVSAGAAFACAAIAGLLEPVLEGFKRRTAANARNFYPGNFYPSLARGADPVFPHADIYRETILANVDDATLARLRTGPEIRIFLARPPCWLGPVSGVAVAVLAYQLDRLTRGEAHPVWARRLGFEGEVVSVRVCETGDELADLILQSSCAPPIMPLCRRDGGIVLDGGLIDNVPVETVAGARSTLVLLTSCYEEGAIPETPGRTYVQPSRPTPIAKWDYTSPDLVQETYDLGRRDAEAFTAAWPEHESAERRIAS